MKKILAVIMCAVLLMCTFTVGAFAAKEKEETDLVFSIKGAEGKPGDIVTIEVYLDKNPGTWACKFETRFNERYFTLLSVDNGDVFSDSEFMKSLLTKRGTYEYYAEGNQFDVNNYNTGLILTLTFEINAQTPAGEYDFSLYFPDDGYGWFFDGASLLGDVINYTVSAKNVATVKVEGSADAPAADDTTAAPDTDAKDTEDTETNKAPETQKDAPGLPVYEVVTDEEGEVKRDDDGSVVTKHAYDDKGNFLYYETERDGDVVTDKEGNNVVFADTTGKDEETTKAPENSGSDEQTSEEDGGISPYKIILIAAVGAVIIGAIIVVIVLTRPKKKDEE